MDYVPGKEIVVARYERTIEKIAENGSSEVKAWLTKNTTNNVPWVLRALPEYVQVLKNQFPGVLDVMKHSRNSGCVNGTALLSIEQKVSTVDAEKRPKYLYRTIHGDQPYGGIKARLGRGTDPIFLHIHLRKHLRWRCRELSPFLSATDSKEKAIRIATLYDLRGLQNITILRFKTTGSAWDHGVQRLWDPKLLLRDLNLYGDLMPWLDNEFLVEHSIPESSITERWDWGSESQRNEVDPGGRYEEIAKFYYRGKHNMAIKRKEKRDAVKKEAENLASRKRKVSEEGGETGKDRNTGNDNEDGSEPEQKKRKYGKRVNVGPKMRRDGGA
ncbi:hypothetical protein CNYM01_08277 [Colletotrichum nymphaeae SA-01]|uniref:DUF7587 domain-containing protein n=1 Tax=Colletotrichum nymphaeae SA-01 TaxID=1460502 RepID=A0A135TMJ3_9PEZI|nr:hypothetical protein CNYM01_08277 [Colletotrichum nymphaeae SA-01]